MRLGSRLALTAALPLLLGAPRAVSAQSEDDPALVAKGAYLATVAGCGSCHTVQGGKPLSGGVDIQTPFGPMRGANITPDPDTGIGTWSKTDFTNALREGTRKDGAPIYPTMPYDHFTKITDADIDALWAYVRSVEPVNKQVTVNELPPPYNIRASLRGWKLLFFEAGRFEPDPSMTDEQQRGAYLVEALGHCGACHTPRNTLGGPERDQALQGGGIEEWYAPDISNDDRSVLANFTVDSLTEYLATGHDGQNRTPFGKMSEVVYDELARIEKSDVHAIAAYLKARKPETQRAAVEPVELAPERRLAGSDLYAENCMSCHGDDGVGKLGVAGRIADNGAVYDGPPDNVVSVLLQGIEARGDWGVMPAYNTKLSDQQIADIANYVRTSWRNTTDSLATAQTVADLRRDGDVSSATSSQVAICASVPADRIDPDTRSALGGLGEPVTTDALAPIVRSYDEKHPDLSATNRITALTGAYCDSVAKRIDDHDKVVAYQLAFMNTINDLIGPK